MKKYKAILFDLDGTLTCSGDGILYSVREAFAQMNKPLPPIEELRRFIGPPLADSMKRCGFTPEESKQGIVLYKKSYAEKGMYMNSVYEGIPQVLETLRSQGYLLATATTKMNAFAIKVMDYFSLTEHFDFIGAASADDTRKSKAQVISYTLENMKIAPDETVLVGDTIYDAQGAVDTGCDFIGVTYGYGTREEMTRYCSNARFADTPQDILNLILI